MKLFMDLLSSFLTCSHASGIPKIGTTSDYVVVSTRKKGKVLNFCFCSVLTSSHSHKFMRCSHTESVLEKPRDFVVFISVGLWGI